MVLTEIEKLDGRYPGVLFQTKAYLDRGESPQAIADHINAAFGISICGSTVSNFRAKRWTPERELKTLKAVTIKAAIETFGGDAGMDAAVLAKLWELMDRMTIPQLLAARTLFVKVRAQNLKEQEFLYKTGQLKPGGAPGSGEQEAGDSETKRKRVMNRIRAIFALPPLPMDAEDEETGNEEPEDKDDIAEAGSNRS